MITRHTLSLSRPAIHPEALGYFRFGKLGDGIVLTNELGDWHHLGEDAFHELLEGRLDPGSEDYPALLAKGFVREGLEMDSVAERFKRKRRYVGVGPSLHRVHLVGAEGAMTVDTLKEVLDHVMLTTAASLEIDLIAGPGPLPVETLRFALDYGVEKNRYEGKGLTWRVNATLSADDASGIEWLTQKNIRVRSSLDAAGGDDAARAGIRALHAAYAARGRNADDWNVSVELTVGASAAGKGRAAAEGLAGLGVRHFRLSPRFEGDGAISAADFGAFYRDLLDALLEQDAKGTRVVESLSQAILTRVFSDDDAGDPELRSPTGAGSAEVVYDANGDIFPNEAARALHQQGESMFLLGRVGQLSYKEMVAHPTLRTLAMASLLECLPGWADRWTTPFLGVDPVRAYAATGDLFPRISTSARAQAMDGMVQHLFERFIADDGAIDALRGWGVSA